LRYLSDVTAIEYNRSRARTN